MKRLLIVFSLMLIATISWAQDWERLYNDRTIVNMQVTIDGSRADSEDQILIQAIMTLPNGKEELRGECYAANSSYKTPFGSTRTITQLSVYGDTDEHGQKFFLRFWCNGVKFDSKKTINFDGETHGTPTEAETYELFDLAKASNVFVLDDINMAKDSTVDIDELLYFKWSGDSVRYLNRLDPAPAYNYRLASDSYIEVDASASSVIRAKRPTTKAGHLYTGSISFGSDSTAVTREFTTRIFVTPFDRWTNDVVLGLRNIRLEMNDSVRNLAPYVYFDIPKADGNGYDTVDYADLESVLGYMPEGLNLRLEHEGYLEQAYDNQPLKVKTVKRTPRNGVSIRLKGTDAFGWDKEASARLYITPYEMFNDSTYITLSDIALEKNQDADLRDYITFHFPNYEADPTSISGDLITKDVAYKDLQATLGYEPEFTLNVTSTSEYYSVEGFTIVGKKRTLAPETLSICLTGTNVTFSGAASANVTVTQSTISVEGIAFEGVTLPWVADRDSKTSAKIAVTPANANYDTENIQVMIREDSGLNLPSYWTLEHHAIVQKTDGLYLEITPRVAGCRLSIEVSYDDPDMGHLMTSTQLEVAGKQQIRTGWGWYTLNCLDGNTSIDNVDAQYFNNTLLDARSQFLNSYKDPTYGFFGSLWTLDASTAYRIKSTAAASTEVSFQNEGLLDVLSEGYELTLSKGYNWIPYRYQYTHTLNELSENGLEFTGRIISKNDGFAENNGNGWVGTLTTLQPGESYLVYRESDGRADCSLRGEWMLNQPQQNAANSGLGENQSKRMPGAADHGQWLYNADDYAGNMTIVAELANIPDAKEMTIGAFVNGECRGEGQCVTDEEGRQYMFITVHGEGDELVDFVLACNGAEFNLSETLPFSTGVGSLNAPFRFVAPGVVPTAIPMASVETDAECPVYDLAGRRVSAHSNGITITRGKTVIR